MDLKIKYNKDKSRMQVTLTVKHADYIHEEKVYSTSYIVKELKKRDIVVTQEQCIGPAKVLNYNGPKKCTGTWTFSLPKAQPTKSSTVAKKNVTPSKKTAKTKTTKTKTTKRV